jgi:CelD/BcsL family acetyltransferase involved in cellulose biosynthesis
MSEHVNHDALLAAIRQASAAEDAAYRALADSPPGDSPARLIDYVRASTRRATLNEAGLILTLGTGEDDDGEV